MSKLPKGVPQSAPNPPPQRTIGAAARQIFEANHPIQEVARVRFLAIVDAEGRNRIELGTQPNGDAYALFFDQNGVSRAIVGLQGETPTVRLFDASGTQRAVLSGFEIGGALQFTDENGAEELLITGDGIRPLEEV